MEVVVHGTKGGYRVLYKTQGAPSIASDIRNNADSQSSMGKSVYAIAFVPNGVVFSKYKIISDTLRNSATGFIAFSLFLPTGERFSGVDTKSILDELLDHYVNNYIVSNQMNRGERTQIIPEDWNFISDILGKYTTMRDSSDNQLQPGAEDAAFIYYNSDGELIDYFAKPFQEEYCNYKQVFLINSELKATSDIINVLRNSGVELKNIDLKNEYFYLNSYNRSKGIIITANGKTRSDGKNNNLIRAKDRVEIKFNKDDKFYFPIEAKGSISDPTSDIYKYLDIRGNQILLKYEAFSYPIPKTKTMNLDIKDRNGNPFNDAIIICKSGLESKTVNSNNQITFKGEEIGKRWSVSVTKGDNWFLENHPIDLIRDCPGDIGTVILKLKERKKVVFEGMLNDTQIPNIKVTIGQKGINEGSPRVEFINEEIEKTYRVEGTYHNGYDKYSGQKSFSPKNHETLLIPLEKVEIKKYSFTAGKHGNKIENSQNFAIDKKGKDVVSFIKPNKGWKFSHFESDKNGQLVAQYKSIYRPYILGASILSVLFISAATWLFWPKEEVQNKSLAKSTIESYVEGVDLNTDTLISYKTIWKNQNTEKKSENIVIWYNPLTWTIFNQTSKPSYHTNWQEASVWIDDAIKKRNSIDNWDFVKLKDSTKYSNNQLLFKNAIKKVDSAKYVTIKNRFNNVSQWNLNQIADSINNFLKLKDSLKVDSSADKEALSREEVDKTIIQEGKKASEKAKNYNQSKEETRIEKRHVNQTENKSKTSEVKRDLQSGTITKIQLEEYKNENNADVQKSIELYLQFWELVKNSNQKPDFDKLLKRVNNDSTLKNSELKSFLNSICKNSDEFQKFNVIPGKVTFKTIKEIKDKLK